ncbi:MAG TPA: hypothetical protein DCE80_16035, partial [Ignavibacteriales bacterium]|nr:hypothetical protein [Ignavibacteriales bacterium]
PLNFEIGKGVSNSTTQTRGNWKFDEKIKVNWLQFVFFRYFTKQLESFLWFGYLPITQSIYTSTEELIK